MYVCERCRLRPDVAASSSKASSARRALALTRRGILTLLCGLPAYWIMCVTALSTWS